MRRALLLAALVLAAAASLAAAQGRYGRIFSATTVLGPGLPDLIGVEAGADGEPGCHAACDARPTACRAFAYAGPGACYLFGNCTAAAMARALPGAACERGPAAASAAPLGRWWAVGSADLCEELAAATANATSFVYDVQTGACYARSECRLAAVDGYTRWTADPC